MGMRRHIGLLRSLFAWLLLTASAHTLATEAPFFAYQASYALERDGSQVGKSSFSLQQTGDGEWRYQSIAEPTGWIALLASSTVTEQSHWQWKDGAMRVSQYRYDRSGREKHIHLQFDWDKKRVTNSINGDHWVMDIPDGTLDKLSVNLGLTVHLANGKKQVSLPVADGGKLKYYEFKVTGEEMLDTALGQLHCLRVARNKRGRKGKQTTLWLAPELGYLAVRIEKEKKDETLVLNLQSLERLTSPAPLSQTGINN